MNTNLMPVTCLCGERVVLLNASGHSTTLCCPRCCHGVLLINHPNFQASIVLENFCRKRGVVQGQRSLEDRHFAEYLVDSLLQDLWPIPAVIIDFGIASEDHLSALQFAVNAGVSAYDLDRVLGNGPAITCLVQSVPDQPYPDVVFVTFYDGTPWDCEGPE